MSSDDEPPSKKSRTRDVSKCITCNKSLRHLTGFHLKIVDRKHAAEVHTKYGQFVQVDDTICSKCYSKLRLQKSEKTKDEQSVTSDKNVTENEPFSEIEEQAWKMSVQDSQSDIDNTPSWDKKSETIESSQKTDTSGSDPSYVHIETIKVENVFMSISRTIATHKYCFMCKGTANLQNVPFDSRIQVFKKRRIFIPSRNVCCKIHLIKNRFYEEELSKICVYDQECEIESKEVVRFLEVLSDSSDARFHDKIGEYELSEERVRALTGYPWENILTLRDMMTTMRNSENRNITQALVIFLIKLRTGISDLCISALLEIEEKLIQRSIAAVLKCFEEEVLPKNFGYQSVSREFLLSQASPIATALFNLQNRLALIYDGTYLRHQKSSNNVYQRKSYSGQKKTPLCKPFTIATTNGLTVNVDGPFNANLNDAKILEELLESSEGLKSIIKKGDVFILDRGFRDVVPYLEIKGYEVLMPALKGKRNQLTVKESNESRLVTKVRWVVEAIHGIIGQKFKLLHHQLHNSLLHSAGVYCRIACFLNNKFGKRLNSDLGKVDLILERINSTKNLRNTLAEFVEENNWNQKTIPFHEMSSDDLLDFPELTVNELKVLFTGTYQLSQAVCYLSEMLGEEDVLFFKHAKEENGIIRFQVRSRHINSKTYKSYVQYEPHTYGIRGILRYCCNCANGNRTVGCCSHVATIIYYLGYARYLSKIPKPAEQLISLFDFTNVVSVIEEDSDDD